MTPQPAAPESSTDPAADGQGGGDVVLSWWQNPVNVVTLLVATLVVAGMVGWLIGDAGNDRGGDDASEVDVGFLQDMRAHHLQAINMSFLYLELPDTDPRLRTVARSIIFDQGVEVGLMTQLLNDLGAPVANPDGLAMEWMGHTVAAEEMAGMASDEELEELAAAEGAEADRLFVELMTAHHEGGIEMAEAAAEQAENPTVRTYADAWARGQQAEIEEMQGLLANPPDD